MSGNLGCVIVAVDGSEAILAHALAICSEKKVKVKTHVVVGYPKEKICEAVENLHADLLVMGSRAFGPLKRRVDPLMKQMRKAKSWFQSRDRLPPVLEEIIYKTTNKMFNECCQSVTQCVSSLLSKLGSNGVVAFSSKLGSNGAP